MLIADAQLELRQAYVGGGPGVIVSGLVWLAATFVLAAPLVAVTELAFGVFLTVRARAVARR